MKYIKVIITLFIIASSLDAKSLYNMPKGWAKSPSRSLEGTMMLALEQYKSPKEGIQITVIKNPRVASPDEIVNTVGGALAGMKKKGYHHISTVEKKFRGHEHRHLKGEYRSDEYEGAYLADTHIIFTPSGTVIMSISIDDASPELTLGAKLIDNLDIEDYNSDSDTKKIVEESPAFQMGYKIGYFGGFIATIILIIFVIRPFLKS